MPSGVLLHRKEGSRGDVVAYSSRAVARLGVQVGMPLTEARLLIGSEPVVIRRHEPERDAEGLLALAHQSEALSPWVGLESSPPNDSLLLDVTGCDHLDGGEDAMVRRIGSTFRKWGWSVRLGLADSVAVAWAITHSPVRQRDLCCDSIVPPGSIGHRDRLRPLPVFVLRFPPTALQALEKLGVRTVTDWERLPREDLKSRFGAETVLRWKQACGEVNEAITPIRPEGVNSAGEAFEWPLADRRAILAVVEQLVRRVSRVVRERRASEGVTALRVRLGVQKPIDIGLARPTTEQTELMGIVAGRLEREWLHGPIGAVTVRVTETARMTWRQGDLFETDAAREERNAVGEVNALLDRLRTRMPPEQITRPELRDRFLPEESQTLVPIERVTASPENTPLPKRKTRRTKRSSKPTQEEQQIPNHRAEWTPASRPLTLLPTPEPIVVVYLHPDGPPRNVTRGRMTARVIESRGPERIETAWWEDRQQKRDYYRIDLENGHRWWVYRDLREGRWFLHGLFD